MKTFFIFLIMTLIIVLILLSFILRNRRQLHQISTLRQLKKLYFIHIPKNAGISIELQGLKSGYQWGIFHTGPFKVHSITVDRYRQLRKLSHHHDFFLVSRNPYTRVISEFFCNYDFHRRLRSFKTKEDFNNYLEFKIKNRNIINRSVFSPQNGHYIEQYRFLPPPGLKCHVLRFENLTSDFNQLMVQYQYPIRLKTHFNHGKRSHKKFGLKDLSPQNIDLIRRVYQKDFEIFNYSQSVPI